MLLFLPSPGHTVADVEAKLGGPWLARLASKPWRGEAVVELPKFDFGCEYDLRAALVPMGMGAAFDPDRADFSGIAPGLFVGAAVQKACITVDEDGTEAAAATTAELALTSFVPEQPPKRQFVADRPFLFLVRETRTGLVLFMGRVTKP